MIRSYIPKYLMAGFYLLTILLGNYFVIYFGILDFIISQNGNALFTLTAPAGVLWIGLTFSFRDLAQRFWGTHKIWIWMVIATIITYLYNRNIALASVLSFLISETIDWIIFTITRLNLKYRIIISNLIAAPLDSFIFVYIAFGFILDAMIGQALLKVLFSLLIIPILPLFDKLYFYMTGVKNEFK